MISPKPTSFAYADALLDRVEPLALEEIGRVHRVACLPQLVREGVEARGLALCVVEEEYLSHVASFRDPLSW